MLRGITPPSTNFNYDINRERFYIVRSEYDYEDTSLIRIITPQNLSAQLEMY